MLWESLQKFESGFSEYSEFISAFSGFFFAIFAAPLYSSIMHYCGNPDSPVNVIPSILGGILIVVFVVSLTVQVRNRISITKLRRENAELNKTLGDLTAEDSNHQKDILETVEFLNRHIGSQLLHFGTQKENNERISLYVHDAKDFFPIARFSENPEYNKKSRRWYPRDQGAISKAWQNGEYFKKYPQPETEEYYEYLEREENIPQEISRQFKMKPWIIYGFRIGSPDNPIAIFIVESTSKNRYTGKELSDIFGNCRDTQICIEIILKLRLPNPNLGEEWEDK